MLMRQFGVSETRACKLIGQHRSTQRYVPKAPPDEREEHLAWLKAYALTNPRCGYRRALAEMVSQGYQVSKNYVQKLWREAGLKVPYKKKRRKLRVLLSGWHRPLYANVTWAMAFQFDQSEDKRVLKLLNVVDEYDRRWLAAKAAKFIDAAGVIATLDDLVAEHGVPRQLRTDNGPEFIADALADWTAEMGVELLFIEPGSPWQHGVIESLNGRVRDEYLNGELFLDVTEAQVILDHAREQYHANRRHSSLGYLTPAEFGALLVIEQRQAIKGATRQRGWLAPQLKAA
jgi:putative transposase